MLLTELFLFLEYMKDTAKHMAKYILLTILSFLFVPWASARIWTAKNGKTFEGEVYKCTKINLTLLGKDKKRVTVNIKNLSDQDIEYLKESYPEFFGDQKTQQEKSDSGKDSSSEEIEDAETQNKWPIIKTDKDSISFRWDTARGKFYTRHYHFDIKKKISPEDAIDLAIRCESAYESVMLLPFIPDKFKRKSAAIRSSDPHLKFTIEITNIPASNVAGTYSYTYSRSGVLQSESIKVEPKQLVKSSDLAKRGFGDEHYFPAGTLAHEISHQILAFAGGTTAIKEGLADFIGYGQFSMSGTVRFDMVEIMLKNESYFKDARGKKKITLPPLKKFLSMTKKDFYRSNRKSDNYNGAILIFLYLAQNAPDNLEKFLSNALSSSNTIGNESAEIERCEAAFKHLLGEKSESDMEKDISHYFSKFGINLNFR